MLSWQAWKNRLGVALVLGAIATQASAADALLSFSATPTPAVVGSTVDLNVQLTGVADLFGYQFTLSFDPSVLQLVGSTEGGLLTSAGNTVFDASSVDNTLGSVFVYSALIGALPGASGSGSLTHLSFNVLTVGSSALTFSDTLFLDSNLGDISLQITNGSLQTAAVPEPASYALFGLGIAGIAGLVALRRRQL